MSHHITIVDPRPDWPEEFRAIAARLRAALGDRALRIDHIGSTAVPGLAAKDIVDVQVTVDALDDDVIDPLVGAGYSLHPWRSDRSPSDVAVPEGGLDKRVLGEPGGGRPTNIHVRVDGRYNQRYALRFRDHLRAHPVVARAYGEAKRALADLVDHDQDAYYAVKEPIFDILRAMAADWAERTGWEPGPPDA
ncbi:MAG: GrpB family protein [Acidimicrobiia bacterium]|nr:GrpB family protein [Acidimicrobiia bacterium]